MSLHNLIRTNQTAIKEIAKRYHAKNIRVFGSMARGDATADSDVDLLADLSDDASLFDRIELLQAFEDLLHRKVDLVTPSKLHWTIKDKILNEAISL